MTVEQRGALLEISRLARSIVREDKADKLLEPFGFTAAGLDIVYEAEAGVDWGERAERWEGGRMVNIHTLAWRLADALNAPDVKYPTDYIGAGKAAEASTRKSVVRLRVLFGDPPPSCKSCGTFALDSMGGQLSELCWGCQSLLTRDYEPDIKQHRSFKPDLDTEWWVREFCTGYCKTFATKAEAEQFAELMQRAQAEFRALYG